MNTTAGSLALLGSRPPNDAFVAAQLRKAGAVILGKTNLSEWANIRSNHATSGWSGRGGLTRNPYALDRNPCGSSSGTGAAVSANLCVAGVGTETDGSVVCPSSANGLAGLKPTVGLVSRSGIIPISHSQDTAGPMARTVRDVAILLGAMAGADSKDSATGDSQGKVYPDYTKFLDPAGLKGARLGVVRKYFGFSDAVDQLMDSLIGEMKHAGAEIVDPSDIPTIGKFDDSEMTVFYYELKADLAAYLARRGGSIKSLKDVIEFNELQSWPGNALLRTGHFSQSGRKGRAHFQRISGCLSPESPTQPRRRHRFCHGQIQARRAPRAHWRSSLGHRPDQRRSL